MIVPVRRLATVPQIPKKKANPARPAADFIGMRVWTYDEM